MYWNVERTRQSFDVFSGDPRPTTFEVRGLAGERVTLDTMRWYPHDEYEAIAQALNALPEYTVAS